MLVRQSAVILPLLFWIAEICSLLGIWGAADVQSKLDGVLRNKTIYEQIARELEVLGYE